MLCITTSPAVYGRVPQKAGSSRLSHCYQLTTADQSLRSPDDAAHIKERHALFAAFIRIGRFNLCEGWVMPPLRYS